MTTTTGRYEFTNGRTSVVVEQGEREGVETVRVLEAGVDAQQDRGSVPCGPPPADPREVEELAVLVDHVRLELHQQFPDPPHVGRTQREGDVEVDREPELRHREPGEAHDPVPVDLLRARCVVVVGRDREHVMPGPHIVAANCDDR